MTQTTDTPDVPQIYLVTPPNPGLAEFPDRLAACLDAAEISCLRLSLAASDADQITRAADALRQVTDARDVALVIDSHIGIAERLGLDGVHLLDGARSVAAARKELGDDAIVGAFCGTSTHDGMNAGERGADYVSFGPVSDTGLGDGSMAELDLFQWWSAMIEVPVVAETITTDADLTRIAPHTDFISLGGALWDMDDPAAELARITSLLARGS